MPGRLFPSSWWTLAFSALPASTGSPTKAILGFPGCGAGPSIPRSCASTQRGYSRIDCVVWPAALTEPTGELAHAVRARVAATPLKRWRSESGLSALSVLLDGLEFMPQPFQMSTHHSRPTSLCWRARQYAGRRCKRLKNIDLNLLELMLITQCQGKGAVAAMDFRRHSTERYADLRKVSARSSLRRRGRRRPEVHRP